MQGWFNGCIGKLYKYVQMQFWKVSIRIGLWSHSCKHSQIQQSGLSMSLDSYNSNAVGSNNAYYMCLYLKCGSAMFDVCFIHAFSSCSISSFCMIVLIDINKHTIGKKRTVCWRKLINWNCLVDEAHSEKHMAMNNPSSIITILLTSHWSQFYSPVSSSLVVTILIVTEINWAVAIYCFCRSPFCFSFWMHWRSIFVRYCHFLVPVETRTTSRRQLGK